MLQAIRDQLALKKFPEAFKMAKKQIEETPQSRDALHLGAIAATRVGDFDSAEQWFREAMLQAPDDPVLAMNYAQLQISRGEISKAKDGFKHAAQLNPNAPQPHANLGHIAALSGDTKGAEEMYMTALRADPNSLAALLGQAHLLLDRGEVKQALELANRAGKVQPKDARVQLLLGRAMAANGNMAFAHQALVNAVQIQPRFFAARVLLARILLQEGSLQAAFEQIETAQKVAPQAAENDMGFLLCRADLLLRSKQLPAAANDLDKVLARKPLHESALPTRLMVYRALREFDQLFTHLEGLCKQHPQDIGLNHLHLNHVLELKGTNAAIATAKIWTEAANDNGYAWVHYASLLENLNRLDEARDAAEKALSLDGKVVQAALISARSKLRSGRPNDAMQLINQALLQPMDPQQQFNALSLKGRIQDSLGSRAEAVTSWQQAASKIANLPRMRVLDEPKTLGAITPVTATDTDDARIVFMLGAPMSGTEACAWYLSGMQFAHVMVDRRSEGGGERQDLLSRVQAQRFDHAFGESELLHIRSRYLKALRRFTDPAAKLVVDWVPVIDTRQYQVLRAALPNARWLLVKRDARDCLLNCLASGAAGVPINDLNYSANLLKSLSAHIDHIGELAKGDAQVTQFHFEGTQADLKTFQQVTAAFAQPLLEGETAAERWQRATTTLGGIPAFFPSQRWQAFSASLDAAFKLIA
jgi:tetratricopeptide (TPR) repeat protein